MNGFGKGSQFFVLIKDDSKVGDTEKPESKDVLCPRQDQSQWQRALRLDSTCWASGSDHSIFVGFGVGPMLKSCAIGVGVPVSNLKESK